MEMSKFDEFRDGLAAKQRSPLFQLVMDDLDSRDTKGKQVWNKYLKSSDRLDWLKELYEELLDACVYLRGELERRKEER